jgi:SSS family solute:Na+ symporter
VLIAVTLLTPPESPQTLRRFYERCRPPGFWGPVRDRAEAETHGAATARLLVDGLIGVLACLALVLATNAIFTQSWGTVLLAATAAVGLGAWLTARILGPRVAVTEERSSPA